jgi:hypothetical protein
MVAQVWFLHSDDKGTWVQRLIQMACIQANGFNCGLAWLRSQKQEAVVCSEDDAVARSTVSGHSRIVASADNVESACVGCVAVGSVAVWGRSLE